MSWAAWWTTKVAPEAEASAPSLKVILLNGEHQPRSTCEFPIDGKCVYTIRKHVAKALGMHDEQGCVFKLIGDNPGGVLWYSYLSGDDTRGVLMGYNRSNGQFTNVAHSEATESAQPIQPLCIQEPVKSSSNIVENSTSPTASELLKSFSEAALPVEKKKPAVSRRRAEMAPIESIGGKRTQKKIRVFDL